MACVRWLYYRYCKSQEFYFKYKNMDSFLLVMPNIFTSYIIAD